MFYHEFILNFDSTVESQERMLSGRAMCRHLFSLGVAAQKVVRKQDTGYYIAEFFVPGMTEATVGARTWATRIRDVLPSARIVSVDDLIADWRPQQPVICATVVFQLQA